MPSFFLKTFGCTLSHAEGDAIDQALTRAGWEKLSHSQQADWIIVNTCGVKEPTAQKILYFLKRIAREKKPSANLVVLGCLTVDPRLKEELKDAILIAPSDWRELEHILRLKIPFPAEPQGFIYRLPVQSGCPRACTFCFTRFARRSLWSLDEGTAMRKIAQAEKCGVLEVQLCGVDLANYELGKGKTLIHLLKKINTLKLERVRIRVGMMNPAFAKAHLSELIQLLAKGPYFRFIHLPVQTGSELVCRSMARAHDVSSFKQLAREFRAKGFTIATDIIVGYPTESEEDFKATIKLLEELKPDVVNLSKFTPRPFTSASKLKQLPTQIIKARARVLHGLIRKITQEHLRTYIGKRLLVRFVEKGKRGVKGRSEDYREVVVFESSVLGKIAWVKIIDTTPTSLVGEVDEVVVE